MAVGHIYKCSSNRWKPSALGQGYTWATPKYAGAGLRCLKDIYALRAYMRGPGISIKVHNISIKVHNISTT